MAFTSLERSILRTLVYYDILDYPLTATEVWKWLYRPDVPEMERGLQTIRMLLEHDGPLREYIERTEGFYHLKDRSDMVLERKWRNNRVDWQMRKTVRMCKILRFVPWVKSILIASSLAIGNVKETSDIDLVIITEKDRLWLTRLFVVGIAKLLHKRPTPGKTKDMFCFTFFISEDALNIERASIDHDDIVFQYYAINFMSMYDPDGAYSKYLEANQWLEQHIPNGYFEQRCVREVKRSSWLTMIHRMIGVCAVPFSSGPLANWCKDMQLRILPHNLKSLANIDTRVIISDTMVKLHDKDNRMEVARLWHERCSRYGI